MNERWVTNASPIILLAKVSHVHLLHRSPDELVIPAGVVKEINQIPCTDPAKDWLAGQGAKWIHPSPAIDAVVAAWDLGLGETEVLSWARMDGGFTAIVDDGAARKCAKALGLPVRGTLGIVVLAKRQGLVPYVKPVLDELVKAGIHVEPALLTQTLALAGES